VASTVTFNDVAGQLDTVDINKSEITNIASWCPYNTLASFVVKITP
jgi:hypothetical protein